MTTAYRSHWLPPLLLLWLAPFMGEFLLGNLPLSDPFTLGAVIPLLMFYGAGAVVIREITARAGRGWPTVVALALAYGLIEEGIVTQSLFNPGFATLHLYGYGIVPGIEGSAPWMLFVLALHSVWSIVVPIILVESLFPRLRGTAWVGRAGLTLMCVLYVLGALLLGAAMAFAEQFYAGPVRLAVVAVLAAMVAVLALRLPRRHRDRPSDTAALSPVRLALASLTAGSALFLLFNFGVSTRLLPASVVTIAIAALYAVTIAGIARESRRQGWSDRHVLGLATGAVLTYMWAGWLIQIGQYGLEPAGALVHIGLEIIAVLLLVKAKARLRSPAEIAGGE